MTLLVKAISSLTNRRTETDLNEAESEEDRIVAITKIVFKIMKQN
jgi:hypothetical protein